MGLVGNLHLERGIAYKIEGNYDEALSELRSALETLVRRVSTLAARMPPSTVDTVGRIAEVLRDLRWLPARRRPASQILSPHLVLAVNAVVCTARATFSAGLADRHQVDYRCRPQVVRRSGRPLSVTSGNVRIRPTADAHVVLASNRLATCC